MFCSAPAENFFEGAGNPATGKKTQAGNGIAPSPPGVESLPPTATSPGPQRFAQRFTTAFGLPRYTPTPAQPQRLGRAWGRDRDALGEAMLSERRCSLAARAHPGPLPGDAHPSAAAADPNPIFGAGVPASDLGGGRGGRNRDPLPAPTAREISRRDGVNPARSPGGFAVLPGAGGGGGAVYGPGWRPRGVCCGCALAASFLRLHLPPAAAPVLAVRVGYFPAGAAPRRWDKAWWPPRPPQELLGRRDVSAERRTRRLCECIEPGPHPPPLPPPHV